MIFFEFMGNNENVKCPGSWGIHIQSFKFEYVFKVLTSMHNNFNLISQSDVHQYKQRTVTTWTIPSYYRAKSQATWLYCSIHPWKTLHDSIKTFRSGYVFKKTLKLKPSLRNTDTFFVWFWMMWDLITLVLDDSNPLHLFCIISSLLLWLRLTLFIYFLHYYCYFFLYKCCGHKEHVYQISLGYGHGNFGKIGENMSEEAAAERVLDPKYAIF